MSVRVTGYNQFHQLFATSSNFFLQSSLVPTISPPSKAKIDVPDILSFSVYYDHAVIVLKNGHAIASGNNDDGQIYGGLPIRALKKPTEFQIVDSNNNPILLLTAVCGQNYTLYMSQPNVSTGTSQLAYVFKGFNHGTPVFIDTLAYRPVALFGGCEVSVAIDISGVILVITKDICSSTNHQPFVAVLPNKEKASYAACCSGFHFLWILSMTGKVYMTTPSNGFQTFVQVVELQGINIIGISGSWRHCTAVSDDGRVFVRGSNKYGRLGLGTEVVSKDVEKVERFLEIESLKNKEIVAAYAGYNHTLFQTKQGALLACGYCNFDQLMIGKTKNQSFYSPVDTLIKEKASFCIAGSCLSCAFIDCKPPPFGPNRRVIIKDNVPPAVNASDLALLRNQVLQMESTLSKEEVKETNLRQALSNKTNENEELKHKIEEIEKKLKKLEKRVKDSPKSKCIESIYTTEYSSDGEEELPTIHSKDLVKLKKQKDIGHGITSTSEKVSREQFLTKKTFNPEFYQIQQEKGDSNTQILIDKTKIKLLANAYKKLQSCRSSNIISVENIFYGNESNPPCILFEYHSHNLIDKVASLKSYQKIGLIYEIAHTMRRVHGAGLIHRDLRPENILLNRKMHPVITDFGISELMTVTQQVDKEKNNENRLILIAPELLNKNEEYTNKVDVFSFGMIMYFILASGELPHITSNEIVKGQLPSIPDSFNDLSNNIIIKSLSNDPEERPSFNDITRVIKENEFNLIDDFEKDRHSLNSYLHVPS